MMLGKRLWMAIGGSVELTVIGPGVESFINRALEQGIRPWMIYGGQTKVMMHVDLADARKLRPVARASRVKIRFGKRIGLPFFIGRALRRKAFLAGFCVFVLLIALASTLVWQVDVVGLKNLSPQSVLQAAKELGIDRGSWKGKLSNADELQTALLDKLPELAWAGIRVHGMKVTIEAVEKVPPVKTIPLAAQNIVAAKRGTVVSLFVTHGSAQIERGTVVEPGQVLISGTMQDGKQVAAEGEIKASVWYVSHVEIPLIAVRKTLTGPRLRRDYVLFGNAPVQVTGYSAIPYKQYETRSIDQELQIRGWMVPVRVRTVYYMEYFDQKVQLTSQEAEGRAMELTKADVEHHVEKGGQLTSQTVLQMKAEHGKLYATVKSDVVEDIGRSEPITP